MLSFSLDSEKDTHVNLKHICLWTFSTGEQTSSPSKLTSGETNGYPKEHQILLAWTAQAASRLVYFPIPQNHPRGNIIRERTGYRACVTTTWNKRHHAIWGENLSPLPVLLTVPISWPRSQEAGLCHKTFSTESSVRGKLGAWVNNTFFFCRMAFLRWIASCLMYTKPCWYVRWSSKLKISTSEFCMKAMTGFVLGDMNFVFFTKFMYNCWKFENEGISVYFLASCTNVNQIKISLNPICDSSKKASKTTEN